MRHRTGQRARALAGTVAQTKQRSSEMQDFLMLQLFNRYEPLLRQAAGAPTLSPWMFHQLLAQFAGELATFMREDRHPPDYPLYRHDDLQASFHPLVQDIRTYLSIAIERRAVQIELTERTHGVRTAVVADEELMRTGNFVLAVRAQMPGEHLRERFPQQSKLGPRDRLRDLVNHHLPGVVLKPLSGAPRQLPDIADNHYFQLVREGELWKQLERDSSLALHVGGDFPGLELELWAIRSN
ncbi:MAG: type VI secretion system baseplate subunit TssK [Rubrivivax sp.]|nr:MAG: type VI secretion system baseplate subunit TssK [Rubrivivax sp.]